MSITWALVTNANTPIYCIENSTMRLSNLCLTHPPRWLRDAQMVLTPDSFTWGSSRESLKRNRKQDLPRWIASQFEGRALAVNNFPRKSLRAITSRTIDLSLPSLYRRLNTWAEITYVQPAPKPNHFLQYQVLQSSMRGIFPLLSQEMSSIGQCLVSEAASVRLEHSSSIITTEQKLKKTSVM